MCEASTTQATDGMPADHLNETCWSQRLTRAQMNRSGALSVAPTPSLSVQAVLAVVRR